MENDIIEIAGQKARVVFDDAIQMFHGEFLNLNGSVNFYAERYEDLSHEGMVRLNAFIKIPSVEPPSLEGG